MVGGGDRDLRGGQDDAGRRLEGSPSIAVGDLQDRRDVRLAAVVAQHRRALIGLGGQIGGAGAQVDRGGERGVVDVLRVAAPVAVGVDPDVGPGRRDELHRPDGTVVDEVAVVGAAVGVEDARGPDASASSRGSSPTTR